MESKLLNSPVLTKVEKASFQHSSLALYKWVNSSTRETYVKLDFAVDLDLSYELDDGKLINIDVNNLFIPDASNGIEVE